MSTRQDRVSALTEAGVDTSRFFDVNAATEINQENMDEIANQIVMNGYVKNTKLHRRWVMAQMFRMLNFRYGNRWNHYQDESGFEACLKHHYGYDYQFKMMLDELYVLSKLEESDVECFNERSHFFTKHVVIATCEDYIVKLQEYVNELTVRHCQGKPYKRVKGRDIFETELEKKLYAPIRKKIKSLEDASNYRELYLALRIFSCTMIKLPWDTKKCKVWIDAYKGNGSFYTLKNMVMYHDCVIRADRIYSGMEAVTYLQSKLGEYQGQGWRYMGMLKKCIADNHFDFDAAMREIYG